MSQSSSGLAGLSAKKRQLLEARLRQEGLKTTPTRQIPCRQVSGHPPLSFAQQRLWFIDQVEPGNPAYNITALFRLRGPLRIDLLQRSLDEVIRRHEVLRTTFAKAQGQPVQVIAPHLVVPIQVLDLPVDPTADPMAQVQQLAINAAQRPFDLASGPLLRAMLLRLEASDHVAVLTVHHSVADGWSLELLIQELVLLYAALSNAEEPQLPDLPIQYADFAVWQRGWLQGEVLERQLAYWQQQLAEAPHVLALPTDRPRPPVQTYQGAQHAFEIPLALREGLHTLSRQENATLFMTLLAIFNVLLYRYSGQSDILVGTPIANRSFREIEKLIGFFANTLVLRTRFSPGITFRQLLRQVRETAIGAYAHQDIPFEQLVESLHPERSLSHTPLFQVVFVLNSEPQELAVADLTLQPMAIDNGTAKFDICMVFSDGPTGLKGIIEYNTDLFEAASIARMAEHLTILLQALLADPDQPLGYLPLMTEGEQRQLLIDWNRTDTVYPHDRCFHQLFEEQVARTPHAIALSYAGTVLSYHELNQRANQLAHYLMKLGVGPDVLVGICVQRSIEMIVGFLGILKAGGAYVPIDPSNPAGRIMTILEDSRVPLLLTQAQLRERLASLQTRIICLDETWTSISQECGSNPHNRATADNLAYVIYTSGSTGRPKGVMLAHRGFCNLVSGQIEQFRCGVGSRMLQFTTCTFDVSLWEIGVALASGATLCLMSQELFDSVQNLPAFMRAQGITTAMLPPSLLALLPADNLPDLQVMSSAGERCTREIVQKWAPGRRYINAYGPTEVTVLASSSECYSADPLHPTIGYPLSNYQLYVLDRALQPVPVGVVGELYVGGIGLARGYFNRPDLSAERFVPNPFSTTPGARLYKTGDLVRYLPNGAVDYLGRNDHQVKIRGFRIELGEIENVLEQHPDVGHCLVLLREDTPGDKYLVAYVVPKATTPIASLSVAGLRQFLQERLSAFMIPAAFVVLEAMPLTSSGKVDRKALPTPQRVATSESAIVPPRDSIELRLVQIWEAVLNRQPIGITENFFDLGGHSLLAIRLLDAIQQEFGQALRLSTIFQGATIASLANVLRQQDLALPRSPLVPIQPQGSQPPFFCVHPASGEVLLYRELAQLLGPDQPFYGLEDVEQLRPSGYYPSLEAMAADYIAAIQDVQPVGPYFLGGWSFGGVVAFEMAQQLRRQGHEVGLLAIIDSGTPEFIRANRALHDDTAQLAIMAVELGGLPDSALTEVLAELQQRSPDAQLEYVSEHIRAMQPYWEHCDAAWVGQLMQTFKRRVALLENYQPQPYPEAIMLLQASATLEQARLLDTQTARATAAAGGQLASLGWEQYATGPLTIHLLPGSHAQLITAPIVCLLAEHLRVGLELGCTQASALSLAP